MKLKDERDVEVTREMLRPLETRYQAASFRPQTSYQVWSRRVSRACLKTLSLTILEEMVEIHPTSVVDSIHASSW